MRIARRSDDAVAGSRLEPHRRGLNQHSAGEHKCNFVPGVDMQPAGRTADAAAESHYAALDPPGWIRVDGRQNFKRVGPREWG